MSVFIGYPSFMAYQMMKGKKGNNDDFPSIPGMIARYSASGITNEQMAANPVWVDKTGNGRDLQLKNFSWKGMSGVGGYVVDIDEWGTNSTAAYYERNSIKITATFKENASLGLLYHNIKLRQSCVLKVTGIPEGCDAFLDDRLGNRFYMSEDGVYEIIPSNFLAEALYLSIEKYPERWYRSKLTIEQLPLYPGALVFDGVDDYGVCENFPILTKEKGYTVVALRQWITRGEIAQGLVSNVKNWLKDGAFLLEYRNIQADHLNKPISFGAIGSENDLPHILTYQTSKSYNGVSITTGNFEGTDVLHVGKLAPTNVGTCINAAIWELVFLDHDATEEELTKIKDYFVKTYPWLFPDQAWTVVGKTNEDEDRATIANITGNGNDLILSNFGFAEGSGYGLYAQNYISYAITNRAVYTKTNSSIHVTKSITAGVNFTESARDVTIPSYRIKVTGIQSGQEMIYRGSNNTFLTNIPSDGIYVLPAVENGSNLGFQFVSYTGDCDITIEQIPEYEGYLVTDGVDDEIVSAKLIQFADKFTIVGDWKFMEDRNDNAGLLKSNQIYIYNATTGMRIYLKQGSKNYPFSCKKINALTSDGWVYDEKWDKYKVYPIGSDIDISKRLFLGFYSSNFTKIALKNLGIYNDQLLSKDDCIKAYNYLQTLKAK